MGIFCHTLKKGGGGIFLLHAEQRRYSLQTTESGELFLLNTESDDIFLLNSKVVEISLLTPRSWTCPWRCRGARRQNRIREKKMGRERK